MNALTKGLMQAHAKLTAMRGAGIKRAAPKTVFERLRDKPKSKALALKAYYLDMNLVEQNAGCPDAGITELRADAAARYKEARAAGVAGTIRRTCFDCVAGDDDPGPRQRVRDCKIFDCPLHAVRPWQGVLGLERDAKGSPVRPQTSIP
jgi:hypothetical protein